MMGVGERENPFIKSYDDATDMILDMVEVAHDTFHFLMERYGDEYKVRNLIGFLTTFTSIVLMKDNISLDDYINALTSTYYWITLMRELGRRWLHG
jgi:hypothetical protein